MPAAESRHAGARSASRPRVGERREALKAGARLKSGSSPRAQVSEMQRARLLSAAVATFDELGYTGATVVHITARARVSRRTFYDLFSGREACLLAILQDTVGRLEAEFARASIGALPWRERVRASLEGILAFLDREPALARVCVVQSARGSQRVLEYREELLARLASILDEGRNESARAASIPPLTAEGLVGAVAAIVSKRLLKGTENEPLAALLSGLMSMIVLPYLGPAAAGRERGRAAPVAALGASAARQGAPIGSLEEDPLKDVPMRITYRTARVLQAAAARPGASNRVIGELADTYDQGQVSKLLGRLQRLGLIVNAGGGQAKGEPNAWSLTPLGQGVTQQLALGIANSQKTEGLRS